MTTKHLVRASGGNSIVAEGDALTEGEALQ